MTNHIENLAEALGNVENALRESDFEFDYLKFKGGVLSMVETTSPCCKITLEEKETILWPRKNQ